MPITTLNKVIALFLVGGIVIALTLALHWDHARSFFVASGTAADQPDSEFWVLVGFLIFPVAALLGSVVEGLSEISMQVWLKKARSSKAIACFFLRGSALSNLKEWREMLSDLKGTATSAAKDRELEGEDRRVWRAQSNAMGTLLISANEHEINWVFQHYATFVLASNLAFVLSGAIIYAPLTWLAAAQGLWWPAFGESVSSGARFIIAFLGIVGVWALCTHAVGKYLYCQEFAMRHLYLKSEVEVKPRSSGGKSRPTPALKRTPGGAA